MKRRTKKSHDALVVKESTTKYMAFKRITFNPNIMGGQACIRGMRLPVSLIINLLANGMVVKDILKEYPDLQTEDISEALQYAAWLAREEVHSVVK